MPRPPKCRRINSRPEVTNFMPKGATMHGLEEAFLSMDGLEAIRLADLEGLTHAEAAGRMGVSRQTFGRILARAHRTVAEVLVNGIALRVAGGHVQVEGDVVPVPTPAHRNGSAPVIRIAVTCEGPTLDHVLDPLFGRAAGFLVIDTHRDTIDYVLNDMGREAAQHAGTQAATVLADRQVDALITGYVGPRAFAALTEHGIRVTLGFESMTAREALDRFSSGRYEWADGPNRRLKG